MSEWQQFALTLAGAVLGSSALTAFVTLYFTRGKTSAETRSIDADARAKQSSAHKTDADANRVDADAMQVYMAEVRTAFERWKETMVELGACVRERAESQAENVQLKRAMEVLRQENVDKDKTITELHGRLNDG